MKTRLSLSAVLALIVFGSLYIGFQMARYESQTRIVEVWQQTSSGLVRVSP